MPYNNLSNNERKEALKILYSNAISGIAVSVLVSVALVFAFDITNEKTNHDKVVWLGIMMCVLTLRIIDVGLFLKAQNSRQPYNTHSYLNRFAIGCISTAVSWCGYALWFHSTSSTVEVTTTIAILSALAGGSANLLSGSRFTAVLYSFTLLAPYSFLLALSNDHYQHVLGLLGLTFATIMIASSYKSATFTHSAIKLKNQNRELLNEMENKVEQRTEEIYRLSNTDPLTNLLNRTAFLKNANKQLADNPKEPFALLFVDLDGFKQINDSLGHKVGDKVLKEIALRISNVCNQQLYKCRWGGDEFLILATYQSQTELIEFANKVLQSISAEHETYKYQKWVSATIGMAMYPEHGSDLNTLIRSADIAMYHQKRMAKGNINIYNDSLKLKQEREYLLSQRLASAIEENSLRLVFQPIVDSKTSKVTSFESLLRWQLDGENIFPDEFITIAEQYGLITQMGLWVIEQACIQANKFNHLPTKIAVSVNVSVIQLQDPNFVTKVLKIVNNHQVEPKDLHIEITESVFAEDKLTFLTAVKALQKQGFCISIDDFGTGYSSLSSMLDIGVDIVKIDRSFIQNMDKRGLSIIHAIVQMASSLDFTVVAEGVETIEQANTLTNIGVSHLQGYYFSKPMEVDFVDAYLNEQNKLCR
ncbi:EAL domain-containing protein [Pseudoalteromonas sp. NZS127_1]|uniref:putative bifunctional diguanylate cyclase/phosphodiesterase n=1 Tax=unclassified Pseudoalteromonas TaxID=194690 RepID=UPI0013FD11A1|nr:EAL domain-containing protein [Pseudoalteromonas sp. APC 3358]MBG9995442.1 EAL domain-containing protein [Pseudoalteromonas sp. NZS127_1]MBH0014087.1 EAL domain-containing protein [Pseudoalteromonas sp. NZS100_1]MBH0042705.1 EAL domain-containing protein [Pseudoalteromonas sp. SWXJZ10B]MBH0049880.1 EAL domain-containing protein [Pseudoalteromonas sp. SWYJZ19]MBH0075270.1 EAL domain-containing protein [Pseudoalteromonas sp. SWYJ118]